MFPGQYFPNQYFAEPYWAGSVFIVDVGLGVVESVQLYSPGCESSQKYSPGAEAAQLSGE